MIIRPRKNSKDPEEQFRKLFADLSLHAANGQCQELEQLSVKALSIARAEGWDQLQVSIHNLVGTTWLNKKQYDAAINSFSKAEIIAQSAHQKGDPTAANQLIQVYLYAGVAYFTKGDYRNAAQKYANVIPITKAEEEHFYLMEAHRMLANCFEQEKQYQHALENNKKALIAAQSIEENIRLNCTIPYIGVSCLKLLKKLSLDNEIQFLRQKMHLLLGDQDWENIPAANARKK